jgi:SAM-dependent methyltransferase
MLIDRLWGATRRLTPIQLYPLLAPVHRSRRRARLRQLEAGDRRYLAEHPDVDVPPASLRYSVAGPATISEFLRFGQRAIADMEAALGGVGTSLDAVRDLLDFGCGCGRVARPLTHRWPGLRVTGCDVDERAIDWCRQHVRAATFVVTGPLPPLPFEEHAFDVVWCGSVFTHLDEPRQDRWLQEMRRILRPGGLLLASVHGPDAWKRRVPPWTVARLRRRGMLFVRTGADAGIHPAWYQVAWHTEQYVREHWDAYLGVRRYVRRGLDDLQDIVVAQKPG